MSFSLSLNTPPSKDAPAKPRVEAPRPQYIELKANVHRKLLNRLNLEALASTERSRAEADIRALLFDLIAEESMRARVLTTMSLLGPPLVRPSAVTPIAPEVFTVALSALGLLVVIGGKLSLGRSFGLIPANRGIVSTGLYRVVRHPIYLGYLVTHIAFTVANPTMWNVALLVTADIALMARAVCEEQTLAQDDAYCAYQTKVRWRVVPGLF